MRSSSAQVDSRGLALLTAFHVELDPLTFTQVAKIGALYRRNVNEDILRTVVRLNEAEPSDGIEPFYCTDTGEITALVKIRFG